MAGGGITMMGRGAVICSVGIADSEGLHIKHIAACLGQVIGLLRTHAQIRKKVGKELPLPHLSGHRLKRIRTEPQGVRYFLTDGFNFRLHFLLRTPACCSRTKSGNQYIQFLHLPMFAGQIYTKYDNSRSCALGGGTVPGVHGSVALRLLRGRLMCTGGEHFAPCAQSGFRVLKKLWKNLEKYGRKWKKVLTFAQL